MAFPTVRSRNANGVGTSGPYTANLPASVSAGDLLIVCVGANSGNTPAISGWSSFGPFTSTSAELYVFYKTADGSEGGGTVSVTGIASASAGFRSFAIYDWAAIECSTEATGSSTGPDSPDFSPSWGSADTLWISAFGAMRAGTWSITTQPSSYTDAQSIHGTAGTNRYGCATAERSVAGSSENPGAWVISASCQWAAVTLAIKPSASVLVADTGVYTITGSDAALLAPKSVTADAGVYTLSGQAAGLAAALKLIADAGAYVLSGEAAGLLKGFTMGAVAGAYVLAGQAAGFQAIRTMPADAGAYAITGQSPSTKIGFNLPITAGAYSITGQDAAFQAIRTMPGAAGSYALTGQAAGLKKGFNLTADAAAYAITGQDATPRAGYKLGAAAGAYTLTGQDAATTLGLSDGWQHLWRFFGTVGIDDQDYTNHTTVVKFETNDLADITNGVSLRFNFRSVSGFDVEIDKAYIGHAAVEGSVDFETTPVQITFGGLPSLTIPAGGAAVLSDEISFTYDTAKGLNLAAYILSPGVLPEAFTGIWTDRQAGDSAATVDKTGSWTSALGATLIDRIDIFVSTDPRLAAEAGSYAITGEAAALTAVRAMPVTAGAYVITGQDATLAHKGRKVDAESGAYVIAGQDAELYSGLRMAANAGAYAVSGQAAAFQAVRGLTADAGAYVITGQDAFTAHGRKLGVDTGAYTINGQTAALFALRVMPVVAGSYALTGVAGTLRYGHVAQIDTGIYSLTGQDATLAYGHKLTADAGAYAIIGQTVILARTRVAIAAVGAYTLTGQAAAIVRGRVIYPETGVYLMSGAEVIISGARKRHTMHSMAY